MSRSGAFDTCKVAIDPFWASLTGRTLTGGPYETVKKPQTRRSKSQGRIDNLQRILLDDGDRAQRREWRIFGQPFTLCSPILGKDHR
jgi:hypothetical protein